MTLHTVDYGIFQSLPSGERERITVGIEALGLTLDTAQEVYTDESGQVVGALRLFRDETGSVVVDGDHVRTELVGVTP